MIFVICILIAVVFWVVFYKTDNDGGEVVCATGAVSGVIAAIVMAVIILVNSIGAPAEAARLKQTYDSLTHQVQSEMYNNDNEFGKKELANQVQEWNENLAKNKALQRNFWVGIFTPNIYDEFEFIPVDSLK